MVIFLAKMGHGAMGGGTANRSRCFLQALAPFGTWSKESWYFNTAGKEGKYK